MTVGSIFGGAFRFMRANIGAIAVWSATLFLATLISTIWMAPFYAARLRALQGGEMTASGLGGFVLAMVAMLLIFVVLWTAVFRAVIFPAESRFAYLRAGMDELRLLAVMLILMIGGYLALLLVILAVGALVAILAAAAGSTGVAAVVGVIFGFAILCLATWVAVRFSPAGPLTIYRRKIVIGPAWRLTRGTFWRLFGAYVLVALVLMAIYLPVIFIQMGPVLGDLMHPADPQAAARIAEWQAARYSGGLSPGMIGVAFVSAILGGVALALQAGVTAVATTQLIDQREGGSALVDVFQ